ncbi:MAG TPA: acyl-CoA dehydrogenase family protein [Acidimicrobiales bacterium]|nr:acyl-CoA dehydrogenase family protein [Acidimicrobiales bacterium]
MTIAEEVRGWLTESWNDDLTLRQWWERLAAAGWAFPTWPDGYGGRGLSPADARAVGDALTEVGAIAPPAGLGQMMGAPVVLDHGTDEQRDRWVRDLAAGRESWCQLFSEPGAGSDLASLQTRAVRDGDVWIVNGQKVWTSGARTADRAMLVARTNPDAPKHKGITYFIIDMDQPGIDVRPLKQMDGGASFNEVFITDAIVADDCVIGSANNGWMVAVATLAYERQGIGGRGGAGIMAGAPGEKNGLLDVRVGELKDRARRARGEQAAMQAATSNKAAFELAREFGRDTDPVMRQEIMKYHVLGEVHRMNLQRARAAAQTGKKPGPEVSTAKLMTSRLAHTARDVFLGIEGASGMLLGDDAPHGGRYQQVGLRAHASSIAGGSDEIQRNIIGERVLGLPKEPQVDRDVPFRELRVGTQTTRD